MELSTGLRAFLDGLSEYAIFLVDTQGKIGSWNRGCELIFGYQANEIVGSPFSKLFVHEDVSSNTPQAELEVALSTGCFNDERWHERKDGTRFWGRGVIHPIREAGKLTGYGCLLRDETDRKRLGDKLQASNDDLRKFAYMASHDLKEPLRMIYSYLTLLHRKYHSTFDGEGREFIGYVMEGANRMRALVDDLLNFSTVDSSNFKFSPVSCNSILNQVMKDLRLMLNESHAEVELDLEGVDKLFGDSTQLRQLFQNLVSNAAKFRREARTKIRIRGKAIDGFYEFNVEDNGIGMEMRHTGSIFEFFRRLHTRDAYPGTGLGLSICRRIVERHGGKIWVAQTAPGVGTTFKFTLPTPPAN